MCCLHKERACSSIKILIPPASTHLVDKSLKNTATMKNLIFVLVLTCTTTCQILSQDSSYENVFETQMVIDMKATPFSQKCNNKAVVPIDLPATADGWFYKINISPRHRSVESDETLLASVEGLSSTKSHNEIIDFIMPEETKRTANIYILMGKEHADSFSNCGCYEYIEKHIDTKSRTGYLPKRAGGTYYLGIERNSDMKGIQVSVEVVAVK